mmetsp:Transcript_11583/g.24786  ORF Transcript_11583/g.24786 Transcript_11583/m.24786 type:complete len:530 (+) Transcript_11583:106-1695(+)
MKLSAAATILASLSNNYNGVALAFVTPSFPLSSIATRTTATSATPPGVDAVVDPYGSVIDAISSAADAANEAATTSARLASSLRVPTTLPLTLPSSLDIHIDDATLSSIGNGIMTPEAISTAQAKLDVLESNLLRSSDPAVMTKSIVDALDASIAAAEHAASSTSTLASNLADFDGVLSHSMDIYHSNANHFQMLSPESAEVAQAKLALLIHNLSGTTLDLDDRFITNFLGDLDRKLDSLTFGGNVSGSAVVVYGTVALALAYSQREVGVQDYKQELRRKLEEGELDIDALAKDVGIVPAAEATARATVAANGDNEIPQLEDPAIAMAAIDVATPKSPTADIPMGVLVRAATSGATAAKPSASKPAKDEVLAEFSAQREGSTVPNVVATPKPPAYDIPMETLAKAAATDAAADSVIAKPLVSDLVKVERVVKFSTKEDESTVVSVVQKKKRAATKKRKDATANKTPTASPLARLLVQELGLELRDLGEGSGKNGKILIDDVRAFQARMEEAKNSMANNAGGPYFATVSA